VNTQMSNVSVISLREQIVFMRLREVSE